MTAQVGSRDQITERIVVLSACIAQSLIDDQDISDMKRNLH
jgi:hypothetical protein